MLIIEEAAGQEFRYVKDYAVRQDVSLLSKGLQDEKLGRITSGYSGKKW